MTTETLFMLFATIGFYASVFVGAMIVAAVIGSIIDAVRTFRKKRKAARGQTLTVSVPEHNYFPEREYTFTFKNLSERDSFDLGMRVAQAISARDYGDLLEAEYGINSKQLVSTSSNNK